jgi:hypothetical protein
MRADLPLYIAVGESDPVNAGLALLAPLVDSFRSAGLSDVRFTPTPTRDTRSSTKPTAPTSSPT